jgi:hypothetical protein
MSASNFPKKTYILLLLLQCQKQKVEILEAYGKENATTIQKTL